MLHPCEIIAVVCVFRYTYADSTVPSAFADAVPADIKDIQHVALIPGASGNGTFPFNASCPAMVSRSEWHARDPIYNNQTEVKTFLQYPLRYMVYTQTLTGTTVHGTCTDRESCKKTVKAIQDDHMGFSPSSTTKFADIAYNFLIGMDGAVFEGRGWLLKGAYYKPLNTQGIGVAFIGTFPEAGTSVAPMSYEAILAAHQQLRCAISMEYVVSVNYSVIAVRLSPTASQYIDNPDTFPRNPPTAGPMLTPGETAVVSIHCLQCRLGLRHRFGDLRSQECSCFC
ncbi:peptidoglycan recognition protein 3-like [Paramacrobiotus metropolitanus]|uniref:peptidoglycan recognition protein 3-like n=1 Tax=Paramacrobiotus metropolitanus TaxID=2943436 RepID=UPI0024456E9B|nr:peptidoglycan recognition protein 3-like [Paramacrobiotus metropolitanus]